MVVYSSFWNALLYAGDSTRPKQCFLPFPIIGSSRDSAGCATHSIARNDLLATLDASHNQQAMEVSRRTCKSNCKIVRRFSRTTISAIMVWIAVFWGTSPATATPPQLRYVVIISRHGVRSPTWNSERLNQYSTEPWPEWGVPTGYLTAHGRVLMKLMGAFYSDWLSAEGLLKSPGCSDSGRIYIWADNEPRTLETGSALAESLLPGCRIAVHSQMETGSDPLFDPIAAGLAKANLQMAADALRDRMGGQPRQLLETHRSAFDALQYVLTGGKIAPKNLLGTPEEISISTNGKSVELNGPLHTASTLGENLFLEYANGWPGENLGWGRLNAENLFQILELHTTYADLTRRTGYLARVRGSNLLAHVLRSMEQVVTGQTVPGALGNPGDVALILCGHDTNLSNISGILGLSWHLPEYQQDDTPPGGALILSLWRDRDSGQYFVRTQYMAQTPSQMRSATPLTISSPPAKQDVSLPGCEIIDQNRRCSWQAFKNTVQRASDLAFVSTEAGGSATPKRQKAQTIR
jgi:4-phytase/acid phosphatase